MLSRTRGFARGTAVLLCWLGVVVFSHGCGGKKNKSTTAGDGSTSGDSLLLLQGDIPDGLAIRLSDGKDPSYQPVTVKPASASKLSEAEASKLLARMKPLTSEAGDRKEFALRDRSKPAPRPGETIQGAFPPPAQVGPPPGTTNETAKELRVVRWAPEGEVPLAPHLSITFSQPMIAVTSQADTTADGVPVKLTPTPKGKWRWLGTRTLLFDPEPRFPQATEYKVEIPAGTKSLAGNALAQGKTFTFSTPAPRVETFYPLESPQPRDPVMFVKFDQAIDRDKVLATMKVMAAGKTYAVRALDTKELTESAEIRSLIDSAEKNEQKDRYVTFRVGKDLPVDTQIEIQIGPGTPSVEGPLVTKSPQTHSFRTYSALKVSESRCAWGSSCPPMTPWYIEFNNQIDAKKFDPASIRISPDLPGYRANLNGRLLYIQGRSKGRTTYKLTLPAALTDEFGQTLGKNETLTFQVGSAEPTMWGPQGLVVLDPAAKKRSLDVFTINYKALKVRLYQVTAKDWDAFAKYMYDPYDYRNNTYVLKTPPGKRLADTTVKVKSEPDEMAETAIDLSSALSSGAGHVVAVVEPTPWDKDYRPPSINAWIEATSIGLDAFVDDTELIAWASSLADGKPLAGVEVEIAPFGTTATTDEKGIARLPLVAGGARGHHLLLGRRGNDVAILPEQLYWWGDGGNWVKRDPGESLRWFVFDDRAMYKPSEEVHVKGWLRRMDDREGGDLVAMAGAATSVSYVVYGPRDNKILEGTSPVNAAGGFDTRFTLPGTPNLGWARIEMTAIGAGAVSNRTYSHNFQIQEFRRPEFAVSTEASQGPHIVGGGADVSVKASYYAGGDLPGADVHWYVTAQPTSFTPPNRDEYTFGAWVPWWGWSRWGEPLESTDSKSETLQGKTDATGKHLLHMDFLSVKPARPMQVTATATVMDVNRQAWSSSANLLVHPSALYVGLKRDKYFVEQGEPIELQGIVVDQEGNAVEARDAAVRAVRVDWEWENGNYVTKEREPQDCERRSASEAFACKFETPEGGQYKITATVVDDRGRPNQTELTYWVSGGKQPAARDVEQEQVTLIPDKKEYQPGDTAEILLQAPFTPAEGILTVRRSGIVTSERFKLDGKPSKVLTIKITESHIPNVFVQVDLVGSAMRLDDRGKPVEKLPRRPAFAVGTIDLSVPPRQRTLQVSAEPKDKKLAPGGSTTVAVAVRDARGVPVADAEVAVVVVDESVLSLSNYQMADPIATFYAQRPAGGRDHHLRASVTLARPDAQMLQDSGLNKDKARDGDVEYKLDRAAPADEAEATGSGALAVSASRAAPEAAAPPPGAPMSLEEGRMGKKSTRGGGSDTQSVIAVRSNFDALATFAPAVRTDARGLASVAVKVPDNLTRYRVMAVAVAGDKQFGKGESSITARMPLMVRPSAPRFLNFGDTFELPVVVQNQTDANMAIKVAVRASNAAITAGMGREVKVAANDRVEIRFPAAAEMAGTARFQVAAASGEWSDAAEFALPVWTPATTEAFATYGEIDAGAIRQPVAMPRNVVTSFGGLEITTSSTQLQALTDAFLYLVAYPYECAEQVSSRILAVAALRDVLSAFKVEGMPSLASIESSMSRDITKLRGMQNGDGGFAFWRTGDPSWPYLSIHVASALERARSKGYEVPDSMLTQVRSYLREIESYIPHWYPDEVRHTLIAYALYTRKRMGDADPGRARRLIEQAGLEKLPMEAIGWLLGTMTGDRASQGDITRIHRLLDNRVSETAGAANFTTSYSDGGYLILSSDRRVDAVILESLIADKPASDLIPKLVRGLLAHRKRGRWGNTQENAFVLLALDRYFNVYEKVTPNFVARAWLGDFYAGDHAFRGRTTEHHQIDIPMKNLASLGKSDITLQKDGQGRMYYRIGMTYAPSDLSLAAADYGFAVARKYEPVDDPGDVVQLQDRTWKIKAGRRVRVRLTMVAENRRYHVALVDPLPAGLEVMNPALAVTGVIPQDPGQQKSQPYWWWLGTWYEHQNLRDERVEAFASLLWDGVHEYTYVARATTPGNFVVPPAKAEEMYSPETFGRSASDRVIVE